jgi:hypothetical protein
MTSVLVWLLISIHVNTTYESGSPIVPVLKHVYRRLPLAALKLSACYRERGKEEEDGGISKG